MHLGEISFCDRVGFNIKSDEIKGKILGELEQICGFKVIQKHYDRFDTNNCSRLNNMPHVISLRTNGNPYLLYLTKYNYENQCIFIDKKIQHGYFYPRMILSKLWFDPSLFDNTLLDGEMIKTNNGEWHFIINDLICLNNQVLEKQNIIKRVSMVYDILQKKYFNDEFNCCQMFVKKYFRLNEIDTMIDDFIPTLPYTCRGIYFKPFYLKFKDVLLNFDDSLVHKVVRFKYKHIEGKTFKENADEPHEGPCNLHNPHNASRHDEMSSKQHRQPIPIKDKDMESFQYFQSQPAKQPTHSEASSFATANPPVGGTTCKFHVKKTSNTDIYELYENHNDSKCSSVALVNSIKTSKLLKELFRNLNMNEKIEMDCVYNDKFQKYCPIALSRSS